MEKEASRYIGPFYRYGVQLRLPQRPVSKLLPQHRLLFPVEREKEVLDRKERVVRIEVNGKFKAYPVSRLKGSTTLQDRIGNEAVRMEWDEKSMTATVLVSGGNKLSCILSFWFAWYNFHPDTEFYDKPK